MVFFKSLYKTVLLFIATAVFLLLLSAFGIVLWPAFVHSYENYIVLFIFALSVVLSSTY